MGLFDSKKPVVGLFADDADVEKIVELMQAKGYGLENEDELLTLNEHRFNSETPLGVEGTVMPAGSGHATQGSVAPVTQPYDSSSQGIDNEPTRGLLEKLKDTIKAAGVGDEEAEFFARRGAEGAKIVVVKVEEDEVSVIEKIFKENGQARTTTAD